MGNEVAKTTFTGEGRVPLKRTEQIAREQGSLTKEQKLVCPFAQACLGLNCLYLEYLEKNPPFLTIYLKQRHESPPSPMKRFMRRLRETAQARHIDY